MKNNNRIHKFRAFNKIDRVMIYDLNSPTILHGEIIHDPNDILLEYYGKNKHGIDIWEGDILQETRYDDSDFMETEITVSFMEYHDQLGSCGCSIPECDISGLAAFEVDVDRCIVIGNIYENPELLEKK